MEKPKPDTNVFPDRLDILPGVGLCRKIGEVIRFVLYFPNDSTVYDERGAAALLDRELYDQQTLWNDNHEI